jgi:tryptophan-rich sensory protein
MIAIVWTMIYTLSAISMMHFVNVAKGKPYFLAIIGLFVLNGILNAAWSYIFFQGRCWVLRSLIPPSSA